MDGAFCTINETTEKSGIFPFSTFCKLFKETFIFKEIVFLTKALCVLYWSMNNNTGQVGKKWLQAGPPRTVVHVVYCKKKKAPR